MRTTRRGLTVIGLVLIILAIGLVAFLAFRFLRQADSPAEPGTDGVLTEAPVLTEPGDALVDQLGLVTPVDSSATAGDTVGVRVSATTATGTAVANAAVRFEVVAGDGTVTPASATTDDIGEAATLWVLGPGAGRQELRASVAGREAASLTVVVTTTTAGAPPASR